VPGTAVLGAIDGGWAAARTVMSNESAMIGGSGSSTFANLLLLAQEFGRTDDPVVRQRLADYYAREKALGLLADRIMTAVRRRERPPVDPSILKLFIAVNRAISGDLAVAIAGPAGPRTRPAAGRGRARWRAASRSAAAPTRCSATTSPAPASWEPSTDRGAPGARRCGAEGWACVRAVSNRRPSSPSTARPHG
jgi:alkylation response protein AidB-like acyl-CoA dehydrogenase